MLAPLGLDARGEVPAAYPDPPEILFKDLFVAVQTSAIYADGKTFVDAVPNAAPRRILADYRAANPQSPQALKRFTDEHFSLPSAAGPLPTASKATQLAPHYRRAVGSADAQRHDRAALSSLLPLPAPYVVPGGRFREIYYWDSYFTMLGLAAKRPRTIWSRTWCATSPT